MSAEFWGELVLGDRAGLRVVIERADPRIRVSGQLVRLALGKGPGWLAPGCELASDRLVIDGGSGRVVYRIGAYHPDGDWYEAQWPD